MVAILTLVLHIFLVILYLSAVNGVKTCTADNKRLFSAWDWEVRNDNGDAFHINLCQKPEKCSKDVYICKIHVAKNEKQISYSAKPGKTLMTQAGKDKLTFSTNSTGESCGVSEKYTSQIFFYCDINLGFPEIVEDTTCSVIFKFYTNEACHSKPTVPEIPCLVYSDNPKDKFKRDLSPLIKQKGGHFVSSSVLGVDIWINVCREISPNSEVPQHSCPKGSTSCRVDKKVSIGRITSDSQLQYVDGKIKLTYETSSSTCKENATTSITFICPTNFKDGGIGPVLISSASSCHYEIEWKTDYACPDNTKVTQNCTYDDGIVAFDLAKLEKPLKKESYKVKYGDYVYRIKVCSNGQKCGQTDAAVCQINTKDVNAKDISCGDAKSRKVRYADNKLTLIYRNGKQCRNGIERTTIINFRCDPTIEIGLPTFVEEQHCHYFFDWTTRHVCPSRKPGTCSVIDNKKHLTFDLSVLTKTDKNNWIALNSLKTATGRTYYINVCGEVSMPQYKGCLGSAVCEVYQGKGLGIGKYSSPPTVLSSNSLKLNYTGGKCNENGKTITTIIEFVCKYKNMESPPELESRTWDGCEYRFTWTTAAACSLHVATGEDCVLQDSITGNVFDLSELRKGPTGNSKPDYFSVNVTAPDGNQTYNIKVCGPLSKEQCGSKVGNAVCQKTGTKVYSLGKSNSNLYYYDGKLNLTYSHGDKCKRNYRPSRVTHITFFCDEKAGIGKPIYEKETYCVYHFLWYTRFACPPKTFECLVKDSSGEYDLSALVKTDGNWVSRDSVGSKYYINLCRVLYRNDETKGCPVDSSVCMKTSSGNYQNIGQVSTGSLSRNKTKDGHHLALTYQAGKFRTLIYFLCGENSAESGPVFQNNSAVTESMFIFVWTTPAACAVKNKERRSCTGGVTSSKDYGDISILAKKDGEYYEVDGPFKSSKIRFNICENITCGLHKKYTTCFINGKDKKSIGQSLHSTLEYHRNTMVLSYPDGYYMEGKSWGLHAKTIINFICAQNIAKGKPVFRGLEKNIFTIDFQASVACPARTVQCSVSDAAGREYDLSPLGLKRGNWMAADTRAHLDYYINICQPYNPGGTSSSCSGPVGGCQVDLKNHQAHSMGFVRSSPYLSTSGDLTLQYTDGQKCHNVFHRSTRINFFCSKVHGSPVYMTETEECEYIFNWKTPSACPLMKETGKKCLVYDTQYGVLYDLTKFGEGRVDLPGEAMLVLDICRTTAKDTPCKKNDACIIKGGKINSSYPTSIITYYKGVVTIKQSNKKCQIIHKVSCGSNEKANGTVISNRDNCIIEVEWESKVACRPVHGEECSLNFNGSLYDLSVLAKESGNWPVRVAFNETKYSNNRFFLAVCKPLAADKEIEGVQDGSRAAVVINKKVFSLGTMNETLSMKNGFLTMVYGGGSTNLPSCSGNGKSIGAHIQFVCDKVPEGLGGEPVYDGFDSETCIFHFTWVTKAACPVRGLLGGNENRNCTAVHPATMKSIDLRKLYNKNGYTLMDSGTKYKLNVCRDLTNVKGCGSSAGMCKLSNKNYQSVGTLNQTLVYRQGFLYLLYKNGAECRGFSGRKMETLITFLCDRSVAGNGQPRLEKTSYCTHYVSWRTPLACEAEVECMVSDGDQLYDLSPLIKNNGNYEVKDKDGTYLINICRSLVNDSRCPSQAAVCHISAPKNGKTSPSSDLGHATSPPVTKNNTVTLTYPAGLCNKTSAKSTIKFVCEMSEYLGKPILDLNFELCSPKFIWKTSLVCKQETIEENMKCKENRNGEGFCYDFTKLGIHNVKNSRTITTLAICHSGTKQLGSCKDAEVCLNGKPLGTKNNRKIQYRGYGGRGVRIIYDKAVIIMYCGDDHGAQYIGKSIENKYVFNWVTPLVCPPRQLSCIIEKHGKTYDLGVLTKQTSSYLVKYKGDRYRLNICGNIPSTQTGICSSRITAWRNTSKHESQIIGKDTKQELHFIDGDDFPIRLKYSSDNVITGCKDHTTPSILHKFACSNVNHPPYFASFDDAKCLFVFHWRTPAACPEKRRTMRLINDWTFFDARNSYCDLDLAPLKEKLRSQKLFKDCSFGKPSLYSEGEIFDLKVKCSGKDGSILIEVNMRCNDNAPNSTLVIGDKTSKLLLLLWETDLVCDGVRIRSCSNSKASFGGKAAVAVIAVLTAIGAVAALLFFVCKPEKRESAALWIRWHVRKYICCRPSYQASYHYKKVNTGDGDSETDFIMEVNARSLFSDDDDDDDDDDNESDDDDYLLPLDDDLLNLDEE